MNFARASLSKKEKNTDEKKVRKNKMFVLRKKQIVAASLMVLIGIAGYLNWTFKNDAVDPDVAVMYNEAAKRIGEAQMVSGDSAEETPAPEADKMENEAVATSTSGYFAQAKLDREVKRSEAIEMLTKLIETEGTDRESKNNAEEQIHRMADYTEKEVGMENMIRAKGFGDAVAFMSESLVSVAIESEGLNEIDAAQIQDIVTTSTGYTADKIKIVEIKPGQ